MLETSSWVSGLIAGVFCGGTGAVVAPGAGRAGTFGVVDVWAEATPVISASAATAIGIVRMGRLQRSCQLFCEHALGERGSPCRCPTAEDAFPRLLRRWRFSRGEMLSSARGIDIFFDRSARRPCALGRNR